MFTKHINVIPAYTYKETSEEDKRANLVLNDDNPNHCLEEPFIVLCDLMYDEPLAILQIAEVANK